jgi:hypothetical protein
VAISIPFAVCLLFSRIALPFSDWGSLGLGLGTGGMVLGVMYWRYVLPVSLRDALGKLAGKTVARLGFARA